MDRFGQAWMPMGADPAKLASGIDELGRFAEEAGRERPDVVPVVPLPMGEPARARDLVGELQRIGCTGLIHAFKYDDGAAFAEEAGRLAEFSGALGNA